jgi:hypothetical protein
MQLFPKRPKSARGSAAAGERLAKFFAMCEEYKNDEVFCRHSNSSASSRAFPSSRGLILFSKSEKLVLSTERELTKKFCGVVLSFLRK